MELVPRAYQLAIYNSVLENGNTLVVLPTGLGKTLISLMLMRDKIKQGRCLIMSPTKPLAKQHLETIKQNLKIEGVVLITGEMNVNKRINEYKNDIIIATPQTIANDIKNGVLDPIFALCVFDEAHRAVKNYAYTFVSNAVNKKGALILGLTASPGGKRERIEAVVKALNIKNIEIRTVEDKDVAPYVQKSNMIWLKTELSPTQVLIKRNFEILISEHAQNLSAMGFIPPLKNKGKFLELRVRILAIESGIKYKAIVEYSILLNLLHMMELLETQGIYALKKYIEKLNEKESKSAQKLILKGV